MSILVIDTETTGPDPRSARLVQLAAYHMDTDFQHLESLNEIVYPEGFDIPDEAIRIHGITTADARRRGSPLRAVVDRFMAIATSAVSDLHQGWLVAHNLTYDYTVLGCELDRCGLSFGPLAELLPMCTMKAMTTRCNLPGKWGKPKWPRLAEAFAHCGLEAGPDYTAHTAMGDVLACRDIYIHGCAAGWWSP